MRNLYFRYEITADGKALEHSCHGTRTLPTRVENGYLHIAGHNPWRTTSALHRLVAEAHIGPPPSPRHLVRHLNGNKQDNRASNLAYGTHRDNYADDVKNGIRGETWQRKLSDAQQQARRRREEAHQNHFHQTLARKFHAAKRQP